MHVLTTEHTKMQNPFSFQLTIPTTLHSVAPAYSWHPRWPEVTQWRYAREASFSWQPHCTGSQGGSQCCPYHTSNARRVARAWIGCQTASWSEKRGSYSNYINIFKYSIMFNKLFIWYMDICMMACSLDARLCLDMSNNMHIFRGWRNTPSSLYINKIFSLLFCL